MTAWNYNLNCNLNLYNVFGLQTTFLFLHSFPSVISLLYLTLDIVVALEYISVAFSQAMIGRSLFFIVFFFLLSSSCGLQTNTRQKSQTPYSHEHTKPNADARSSCRSSTEVHRSHLWPFTYDWNHSPYSLLGSKWHNWFAFVIHQFLSTLCGR